MNRKGSLLEILFHFTITFPLVALGWMALLRVARVLWDQWQ